MARREREGREIPAAYLDPPALDEGADWYWEAWSTLSSDRQLGMGEGLIPFSALDRFARRHAIDDPDEFDRLCRIVGAMDRVYLARREDKPDKGIVEVVGIDDAAGVKSLLKRMAKATPPSPS